MNQFASRLGTLLGILAVGLVGCGGGSGDEIETHSVSGTVKLDGQPVEGGSITFIPADGQTPTASGVIADGAYSVEVPPGPKKVEIRWSKITGQRKTYNTPDSPMTDVTEEQIPKRYHSPTELTADVTADRDDLNFDLVTK